MKYKLPVKYDDLKPYERRQVREQYIKEQDGKCALCHEDLSGEASKEITKLPIILEAFPPNFLKHPVHLQHDHQTGLTQCAVHAYCNAVLWQYGGI